VGGAVNGGVIYGAPLAHNTSVPNTLRYKVTPRPIYEHLARGVAVPSTSVHQYAATLALWMGVAHDEMGKVIPAITEYPFPALNEADRAWPRYLGFLGSI